MNRQVHKYLCPKCQLLNSPPMDDFIKLPFVSFLIFMFQFAFKFLLGFFFFGFKISHSSGCNLTEKKNISQNQGQGNIIDKFQDTFLITCLLKVTP